MLKMYLNFAMFCTHMGSSGSRLITVITVQDLMLMRRHVRSQDGGGTLKLVVPVI